MFDLFEKYLKEKATFTEQDMELIRASSIIRKIRKHQYLLTEGEVCTNNCFILKGCLRLFRIGEDGVEHILRFGVENWWISDQESYNNGTPSKNFIEALEDGELLLIPKEQFKGIYRQIVRLLLSLLNPLH